MAQLEDINQVIYRELDEGVQDPEGVWDWLSKKRGDLQSLGRGLANREIYDYFTKCKIVLECQFLGVVKGHCLTVEFAKDLEGLDWESPHQKFPEQLSIFENLANSESRRKKFGSEEIYEGVIIPTNQSSNRIPGSRGNDRQKGKGKAKGKATYRNSKEVNWAETIESNNEENYQYEQEEERLPLFNKTRTQKAFL